MNTSITALEWYHSSNHHGDYSYSGYWTLPSHVQPITENGISSFTYNQLLYQILQPLIQVLWECMNVDIQTKSADSESPLCCHEHEHKHEQPIIAICIPEGPYLPITMLAVHIMNIAVAKEYHDSYPNDSIMSPIILPLDPQEGEERLKHMIGDAQPRFIIYSKDTLDGKKMEKLIRSMSEPTGDAIEKTMNDASIVPKKESSLPPKMLDIGTLLFESKKYIKSPKSSSSTSSISSIFQKSEIIPSSTKKITIPTLHSNQNRVSHIVYTSGTTGVPKGTISSIKSLLNYTHAKNKSHEITSSSKVFLASSLSFDPCLSDIIATFYSSGCLCFCEREKMKMDLSFILNVLGVTHVLCTPSLWNSVDMVTSNKNPTLLSSIGGDNNGNNGNDSDKSNETSFLNNEEKNYSLDNLKVVALGGEVMSGRIKGCWARSKEEALDDNNTGKNNEEGVDENGIDKKQYTKKKNQHSLRLLSTYGVTEACVYQTVGEVFAEDMVSKKIGHYIGETMEGVEVRICKETTKSTEQTAEETVPQIVADPLEVGEIVISGSQLDEYSGYLNLPDLTKKKFSKIMSRKSDGSLDSTQYFYRTGDRGVIDPNSGRLYILGRIDGEEGMIKINGVRVELGEIEHAILDSESFSRCFYSRSLVTGCIVVMNKVNDNQDSKLVAYCVLSDECLKEFGLKIEQFKIGDQGLICSPGPLLALLRARCERSIRKECIPSTFVLIPRIPLTRTGKRNRKALPPLDLCQMIDTVIDGGSGNNTSVRLDKYGRCGKFVFNIFIECLNLQLKQQDIITSKANFAMVGGDSLTAALIVRSLYALHHNVNNSRNLGGAYGSLEGPFDVSHLLSSNTLGEYIDFLDSRGVMIEAEGSNASSETSNTDTSETIISSHNKELLLYDSLIEAITLEQGTVAMGLLSVGANPNYGEHGHRLGKLKNKRKEQKQLLKSNPLHLACVRGNNELVAILLQYGCNCKSPDASGQYPLHLACSGSQNKPKSCILESEKEDKSRTECVRLLLEVGKVPLAMKSFSKQTVLHCAARAGHCHLLKFLIDAWEKDERIRANKLWGPSKFDWQDRWFRTPVHWAVLNGKVSALELLMKYCSPAPLLPRKSQNRSNVAIESPFEMCERLYDSKSDVGKKIRLLLNRSD